MPDYCEHVRRPLTNGQKANDYGLHVGTYYSGITDDALDGAIQEIESDFPDVGYRMTHGILIGRGIRVQVSRVREAMRRCESRCIEMATRNA